MLMASAWVELRGMCRLGFLPRAFRRRLGGRGTLVLSEELTRFQELERVVNHVQLPGDNGLSGLEG